MFFIALFTLEMLIKMYSLGFQVVIYSLLLNIGTKVGAFRDISYLYLIDSIVLLLLEV